MNLNRIVIAGRLTADPDLRYSKTGTPFATFGVALEHRWKDRQSGEWQSKTSFVDVVGFGHAANSANKHLSKGAAVLVEGRLDQDEWTDPAGQKRSKLKVIAERVEPAVRRKDAPQGQPAPQPPQQPRHQPAPQQPAPQSQPAPSPAHVPAPPPNDEVPF